MTYIQHIGTALALAAGLRMPSDDELADATRVLSACPVQGMPAFTGDEVKAFGIYRYRLAGPAPYFFDPWKLVLASDALAWPSAIHEAAEIDAFVAAGLDPFDLVRWEADHLEPHLAGVLAELAFLAMWSAQLGFYPPVAELALLDRNPLLRVSVLPELRALDQAELIRRTGWGVPPQVELDRAQRFWDTIGPTP